MSNYRRLYIAGGTYFFTLVTYRRQPIFADYGQVEQLRQSFREVKAKRSFDILAAVVLPDHLHCLWRLPEGDTDFSTRWQMVKTGLPRRIPAIIKKNGAKAVWQPRFYEHCIRDESDFHKHLDYIHYNPVKHGLVSSPGEWPHSSFVRFVALGWYEISWGDAVPADVEDMQHE
ncbi:MAG: transposase [Methylococcaceae bacterium]|nr:transposase [Methylococcaceae bacterium]MDP3905406.1 transposase [Methylococcaceae bacterium]